MGSFAASLKEWAVVAGIALLLLVGIAVVAPLGVFVRPLGIVALVAGAVVYCVSPGFRRWLDTATAPVKA